MKSSLQIRAWDRGRWVRRWMSIKNRRQRLRLLSFGQTSIVKDYQAFHTFEQIAGAEKAICRPEFVKITKKNEVQKYRSSASEGVVEHVSFRGDKMELRVRVNDTVILAKRDLEENRIFVGETVDVFLYRIFVTVGDKAYLLENQSLQENSVVI